MLLAVVASFATNNEVFTIRKPCYCILGIKMFFLFKKWIKLFVHFDILLYF